MDAIRLRAIHVYGRHGAFEGEREKRQLFELDVTVQIDLRRSAASDDLEQTLDYASLHAKLVRIVATTSFALLERLAAALVDAIFTDHRVREAEVTISKPEILDGATPSVTLVRENPRFESQ